MKNEIWGMKYEIGNMRYYMPDGRLTPKTTRGFQYEYFLKDHLGDVMVTFTDANDDGTPEILTKDHYYPFGLTLPDLSYQASGTTNLLKYNSKEKQEDHGLEWYDYGARMYDPVIGRWGVPDLLAEISRRWSPYSYCYNNPMSFIDPDGMLSQSFIDDLMNKSGEGKTTWQNNNDGTFTSNTGETINNSDTQESTPSDGIDPVNDKNKNKISTASWGETSGLYPVKIEKDQKGNNIKPKNKDLNNPETWDPTILLQLLKARAAINLLSSRNSKFHSSSPNLEDPLEKILAAYHLTTNFPTVDTEIKDDADVKYLYLSSNIDATTPSISAKYWDQTKVKTYGPFYSVGGGDAGSGAIYIHFYKAVKKSN